MNANNFHKYVKKVPVKTPLDGTEIVYIGNADPSKANRTTTAAIAGLGGATSNSTETTYLAALTFGAVI